MGYFVDATDGDTPQTGLTIANTDIKLWKAGATSLTNKNSGGASHLADGIYYATLDATDTNTIGSLIVFCHPTGALAVRIECCVLDEAVYDTLFGTLALATSSVETKVDALDALVDSVKAKTDSLSFTVPGQVDANIQYVNDVQVTGTGAVGDEWGP